MKKTSFPGRGFMKQSTQFMRFLQKALYLLALLSLPSCCISGGGGTIQHIPESNNLRNEAVESYDLAIVDDGGNVYPLRLIKVDDWHFHFRAETGTGEKDLSMSLPEGSLWFCSEEYRFEDAGCVEAAKQTVKLRLEESTCPSPLQSEGNCSSRHTASDLAITSDPGGEPFILKGELSVLFSMYHIDAHDEEWCET